jgi:hypothetical protein
MKDNFAMSPVCSVHSVRTRDVLLCLSPVRLGSAVVVKQSKINQINTTQRTKTTSFLLVSTWSTPFRDGKKSWDDMMEGAEILQPAQTIQ